MVSYQKYTLKSGAIRWRACYRDPSGRNLEKAGFKRKGDAEQWAARNVTIAITDGAYVDPHGGRTRIGPLGDNWIAAHKNVWKPSHYHSMETAWRVHVKPQWGERRLNSVTHSEVQQWVSTLSQGVKGKDKQGSDTWVKKPKSPSVVIRAFGVLKGIYESAVKDELILRTPVEDVKLPRKTRKPRVYLTPGQLLALADASGAYRSLILVLGLCGLRWGEATALTVRDIDFKRNRIHVSKSVTKVGSRYELGSPKSNKARDVPMCSMVAEALREHVQDMQENDLVFTGDGGGYVAPQSIGKGHRCWYKTALAASGVPSLTCHDLRHTAASIAVHSGANVKAIQRMLGHSSAAMTLDVYADLFDDDLDDVAARVGETMTRCLAGA